MVSAEHQSATVKVQELGIPGVGGPGNAFLRELNGRVFTQPFLRVSINVSALSFEGRSIVRRGLGHGTLFQARLRMLVLHTAVESGGGYANEQQKDKEAKESSSCASVFF